MNSNSFRGRFFQAVFAVLLTVASAAAQSTVPLGVAESYAVLGGSTVTNTGASVVNGDLGVSPGLAVTGFPPGTITGTEYTGAAAAPGQAAALTAYNDAAGRSPVTEVATELGGQTLVAGVYDSAPGTFGITGILTLDGENNPNAVFIFQTASTLITAAGAPGLSASQVLLTRGAQACNVFWQVGSSATLGTYSNFQGTILALESITAGTEASVNGRLLGRTGAVTLDTNQITRPVCEPGLITIVKNTVGGNGTFPFSSNFGVTSLTTSGGTASQTISDLTPGGSYNVSEVVPDGWTQSSASCTNGTPSAVTVVSGVTTICTFTNTLTPPPPTGSISVVKNTLGGNGVFPFSSNFGLTSLTTSGGTAAQTFTNLTPGGNYSLSENVPSGWNQTSATCDNGTPAAITVVAGVTTTCTITNTLGTPPPLGVITVVKNTVGGNGAFSFSSNFGLTSLTTIGGTASQTFLNLTPGGSFNVSEVVPDGWTQSSAVCSNGTPSAVTVVSGQTTTCTFTNSMIVPPPVGSIRVVKNTVGGNGTFEFSSNFGLISLTTIGGTASETFTDLTPGSGYNVSETVPEGWTQTSATCTNGTPAAVTVAAGVTTTCVFTNTVPAPPPVGSIRIVKNTVGGDGLFRFSSNFGLTSLTTNAGTASRTFTQLTPGSSYSVSETPSSGWTLTSATCTRGTPEAITVLAGLTTTCIFTNTVPAPPPVGLITIVKNTEGGDGVFQFSSNFGLSSLATSGGTASRTFNNLTPGSGYHVSETVPSGWTQTGASCTNGTPTAITVVAGVTTTCTFTNRRVAAAEPDLIIAKTHAGVFQLGDTGRSYVLTVSNIEQGATSGAVTVSDLLPEGLTATAISGPGWSCSLTPLSCTRSDALAPGASYPPITVTVSVAGNGAVFDPALGSSAFQTGDVLIAMADGTVQWRRRDWTLVRVLSSNTDGQAKGMAFDSSGNLYVTHWIGSGSSGNSVAKFDRDGDFSGFFGSGYECNPSSIAFDNSGNAYVGQADCGAAVLKFDSAGNRIGQYSVAVEERGSYHIALDSDQCTMYYTSNGPNVKKYDICHGAQMSNFNNAPLPDPLGGAQNFSMIPGGGMLVANFGMIARLDASGNVVRTYGTSAGSQCWLGAEVDPDGVSFVAANWCASSVVRFDMATGDVIESHVVDENGFMVKQIIIPGNIFDIVVTNTATVAGGGEVNTSNNSAADETTINQIGRLSPEFGSSGIVNAASYAPTVAAGSIASLFGSSLALGQGFAVSVPLPATLAGSSFQFGDHDAALFYVSPRQANLQIPWELEGQTQFPVTVTAGGMTSQQRTASLASFAPGIFTLDGSGSGQGVIVISGTALLAAPDAAGMRPALRGESITIYSTGLGAVSHQPATGHAAQGDPLSVTTSTPTVTIGGVGAVVSFSGLTPGAVGLYQVNVTVPSGAPVGDAVPLTLSIGGVSSNSVTVAVE